MEVSLAAGSRWTFEDFGRRGAWKSSDDDAGFEAIVQKAIAAGGTVFEVG